ncbi:MAG TPA: ABC transporter permease [Clostridia bacterium]|nr:ABC transporter permease [Clostridia bacterium]
MEKRKNIFSKTGKRLKNIFVRVDDREPYLKLMADKAGFKSFVSSVISILIGLLCGYLILIILDSGHSTNAITNVLVTGFSAPDKFAKVLYQAAPLIMTGLAVGFAFKTGLFNIGASGQYMIGTMLALIGALVWQLPWWACLILAVLGGAVWGSIPGIFKALLNVNEVITSIMFNWIGLFTVNITIANLPQMLANYYGASNADRTAGLAVANPSAIIPKLGLDVLLKSQYMNIGIFIAIGVAIIMFIILNKTTFGYELKACGLNRNAAKYAGINAKKNIILAMTISGALAGLGGGLYYLSGIAEYTIMKTLLAMGFNGIPVALLGSSNPLGIIFSGLFISYIQIGGEAMQPEFTVEIINIIIAVIIYMSALSLIIKLVISKLVSRRKLEKYDNTTNNSGEKPPSGKEIISQAGDFGGGILPDEVQNGEEE